MSLLRSAESAWHEVENDTHPRESEKGRATAWNDAMAHAKTVDYDSKATPAPAASGATANERIASKDFEKLLAGIGHDGASLAKAVQHFLSPVAANKTPPGEASAVGVLNRDFGKFDTAAHGGKPDGIISENDLRAVSKDPNATKADVDAAKYLLTHKQARDALDTSDEGGSPDGFISRKDVTNAATDLSIREGNAPLLQSLKNVPGSSCNPTILHIDAQAPAGANWSNKNGNNAGIVSVYVDGHYYADATILSENPKGVDVNLGPLGNGNHTITLRDTTGIGTGSQGRVSNVRASTRQLDVGAANQNERDQALIARWAPVVHLENYNQATDNVPLLTNSQVTDNKNGTTTISYQVLFSNEDGGDAGGSGGAGNETTLWGRDTDYEAVYSVTVDRSGNVIKFQPAPDLNGKGNGQLQTDAHGRPVVTVYNAHNDYNWAAAQPARAQNRIYSDLPVIDQNNSIDLMNHHAWTWKVSTEEEAREGKLASGQPFDRVYLNLAESGHTGSTFKDVTNIQVVWKDKSGHEHVTTVDNYHPGSWFFNIGDNRLNGTSNNVSVVLPKGVTADEVTQVRVEGLHPGAQVQAQRLDPNGDRPVQVPVALAHKPSG